MIRQSDQLPEEKEQPPPSIWNKETFQFIRAWLLLWLFTSILWGAIWYGLKLLVTLP